MVTYDGRDDDTNLGGDVAVNGVNIETYIEEEGDGNNSGMIVGYNIVLSSQIG